MSYDLSDFYKEKTAIKLASHEEELPRTGMYKDELDKMGNPASKIMYLGAQERELNANHAKVDTMLNRAKMGLSGAFDEVASHFAKEEPVTLFVKLPSSMLKDGMLVDEAGATHEKFGAKEITNDEHFKKIAEQFTKAQAYFPDAKLADIEAADGKRVAIVTGVDPVHYNAVLNAERELAKLSLQKEILAEEKKNTLGGMGLNTDVAVSGGANAKAGTFAIAPASEQAKKSNELA